jgi:DNA-binding IclR family transcriptional regulator
VAPRKVKGRAPITVTTTAAKARYRVQAVDRAIACLEAFTQEEPELSLSAVAAHADLAKPTAFRLLATLEVRGLVSHNAATNKYSLGSGILALAAVRARQSGLLDRALPIMRRIRDSVNETISLSVRAGDYRVHLYQLESLHPIRRTTEIGERSPLYAGASNRVLLAAMSDAEIADYLKRTRLEAFTPNTITSAERLWAQIRTVRERGYAESNGERYIGGEAVAAPVRDADGAVIAALYVSVPTARYTPELRSQVIDEVLGGVTQLSRELGYRATPA